MNIQTVILDYRDANNLKWSELAREFDVPESTLKDWAHGRYIPRFDRAIRIMRIVGGNFSDTAPQASAQQRRKPQCSNGGDAVPEIA